MPVTLSIQNVPDDVVRRLRERARKHHRSLQGELLAILEEAVTPSRARTPGEVLDEVRRLGLRAPSEAASIVRSDRDTRAGWERAFERMAEAGDDALLVSRELVHKWDEKGWEC